MRVVRFAEAKAINATIDGNVSLVIMQAIQEHLAIV
jgi:hypothetical protein